MISAKFRGLACFHVLAVAYGSDLLELTPRKLGVACYEAFEKGTATQCPAECPVQTTCSASSKVQCVRAADCSVFHTAGIALNGECINCGEISGCKQCASTTACAICSKDFVLQDDGTCRWRLTGVYTGVWIGIGLLWLWTTTDQLISHCRPIENGAAVAAGLRNRSKTKVRDETKTNRPLYPLWRTDMHTEPICGPGMPLFMNWFVFIVAVALWQILLTVIFAKTDETFDSLDSLCAVIRPTADQTQDKMTFDVDPQLATAYYDGLTTWVVLSYVGTCVMFVIFQFAQRWVWREMHREGSVRPTIHRYAIEASGFPGEVPNYAEIMQYFREVLQGLGEDPNGVAEISIAYSFHEHQDEMNLWVQDHFKLAEDKFLENNKEEVRKMERKTEELQKKYEWLGMSSSDWEEEESSGGYCLFSRQEEETSDEDVVSTVEQSRSYEAREASIRSTKENNAGTFWTQFACWGMLGTDFDYCGIKLAGRTQQAFNQENRKLCLPGCEDKQTLPQFLSEMKSSGKVIVVFKTLGQKRCLRDEWDTASYKFRGEYEIEVKQLHESPLGILWQNYGISTGEHQWRAFLGVVTMICVLILWFFFYGIWFHFTRLSLGDKSSLVAASDTLMGMAIFVGNTIVSFAAVGICDSYGFRHNGHYDMSYLYIIVPCLFTNVISDLYTIMTNSALMLNEHLASSPNFMATFGSRAISEELFALLMPSYALLPYLAEPVGTVATPFLNAVWRIKQDFRIDPAYAEQILLAAEIDIINPPYGDLVASTATFMFTFLSPCSRTLQLKIWISFLVFGSILYFQNRIRILRWQASSYFGTHDEHTTVSYLWCLPLGLLAVAVALQLRGERAEWSVVETWQLGIAVFFVHALLHVLFVRFVITWNFDDFLEQPYEKVLAKRQNDGVYPTYHNTNPIEVLKSIHVPGSNPTIKRPLVMFKAGKGHLQPESIRDERGGYAEEDLSFKQELYEALTCKEPDDIDKDPIFQR